MSSMVSKKYQQPRRVLPEGEGTVLDDKFVKRDADIYTGRVGKNTNPNQYTGRDVAKEKMLREFKKEFKGKMYYGQKEV